MQYMEAAAVVRLVQRQGSIKVANRDQAQNLTEYMQEMYGRPCEVFWAVRDYEGRKTTGFWYQVFADEERKRWTHFGYLGKTFLKAKFEIKRLKI